MNTILVMLMTIMIVLCICSLSIMYYGHIWNPLSLLVIILTIAELMSLFYQNKDAISDSIFWIGIGTLFFSISFLGSQTIKEKYNLNRNYLTLRYNLRTIDSLTSACVILSILLSVWYTYIVLKVAPNFQAIFIHSTYVRNLYLDRSTSPIELLVGTFLSANFYITFCLFPIGIREKRKHIILKLSIVLVLRLYSSIITMSRLSFFIDIVIFVSAFVIQMNDRKEEIGFYKKYGLWFLILGVVLLLVVSFQRNYIGTRYDSYSSAIIDTLKKYFGIPIYSFGVVLNEQNISFMGGKLTFRPIINILSYFGIGSRVSIIQGTIGDSGNVYTMFGNMFLDYGYTGVILVSILFGLVLGMMYSKFKPFTLSKIVINSFIMMSMFFAFYDFELLQTVYIFIMIYAAIIDKFLSNKLYLDTFAEMN